MINKNKEEIEKIEREIELERGNKNIGHFFMKKSKLQERIKTSIEWCEDEIEFLNKLELDDMDEIQMSDDTYLSDYLGDRYSQLQSHLKWLKEKEKEL